MATFQRTWILVVQMTGKTLWPLSSSSPLLAKYLLWSTVSSALPLENWSRTTCKIRRPPKLLFNDKKVWDLEILETFKFQFQIVLHFISKIWVFLYPWVIQNANTERPKILRKIGKIQLFWSCSKTLNRPNCVTL